MTRYTLLLVACLLSGSAHPVSSQPVPEVVHLAPVSPAVVELVVRCGEVAHAVQEPYTPQPGDAVSTPDLQSRWVIRDGQIIGGLVGRDGAILMPFDQLQGEMLDNEWARNPSSYLLSSPGDPRFLTPTQPLQVFGKTRPVNIARTGPWAFSAPLEHHLFLVFSQPLTPGQTYSLAFVDGPLRTTSFEHDPLRTRSEAVHVSQIGFRPDDPAKVAFLSCWMGDAGGAAYQPGLAFFVVDTTTDDVVYAGLTSLARAADESEDAYGLNYNGVDVYRMEFSDLRRPGTYRVCVEGVGCSFPFPVARDAWRLPFVTAMRGFYHQRSGIALAPPLATLTRPRCFHPDDGVVVYASTARLMDTGNGLNQEDSNFGNLVDGLTAEVVENAWGGYMDAGDWDRRIQHLDASLLQLELVELLPEYFTDLELMVPETGNTLPDVVDEALFNIDFYRRLQTDEGGIRGGIESAQHPRYGEASWQESLKVIAYAPGRWSSYYYAAVAVRAAFVLAAIDPDRAAVYQESALRAMTWAEASPGRGLAVDELHQVVDARNHAAAELYRLTGAQRWHDVFLATTKLDHAGATLYEWQDHEQRHAAWVYATTRHPDVDQVVRQHCRDALLKEADDRLESIERAGFSWAKDPWGWGGMAFSSADAVSLIRAYELSHQSTYLAGAVLAAQTGAGANPLNMCYTTGVGQRWPRHPLHVDSRVTDQEPPTGLCVFGPFPFYFADPDTLMAGTTVEPFVFPALEHWPGLESYFDVFWFAFACEYTIHNPMARNAYVWGYLAGRHELGAEPRAASHRRGSP